MNKFLQELKDRGIFKQTTSLKKLEAFFNDKEHTAYIGFDANASSLHVGHLMSLILIKRLKAAGIKTYAIVGDATAQVGDPSGKDKQRPTLVGSGNLNNSIGIEYQIKRIASPYRVLCNASWFDEMGAVDFLTRYGRFFNVNQMLSREQVKNRLATGINFSEFSYQVLQAIDFTKLCFDCETRLQIGGSDQWGNIVSGIDLISKKYPIVFPEVVGMTTNLVLKKNGKKFGKSESGTIWLDGWRTTPYTLYQFFLNLSDEEVYKYLLYFSLDSVKNIKAIIKEHKKKPSLKMAQKILAKEITEIVHSKKALAIAIEISHKVFSNREDELSADALKVFLESIPMACVSMFEDGNILSSLNFNSIISVLNGSVCKSMSEARRLIESGAVSINGKVIRDLEYSFKWDKKDKDPRTLVKIGKRKHCLVKWMKAIK